MREFRHQFLFTRIGLRFGLARALQFRTHDIKAFRKGPKNILAIHFQGNIQITGRNTLRKRLQFLKRHNDRITHISEINSHDQTLNHKSDGSDGQNLLFPSDKNLFTVIGNNDFSHRYSICFYIKNRVTMTNRRIDARTQIMSGFKTDRALLIQYHIIQTGMVMISIQIIPTLLNRIDKFINQNGIRFVALIAYC